MKRARRGVALASVLLVGALLVVILAIMLDVGTVGLRRSTEDLRALQAQAGADGGAGWVRALLYQTRGDLMATLTTLGKNGGEATYAIDADTTVRVRVSIEVANPASESDHRDVALQKNPQVNETPVQVVSTSTVSVDGTDVARRTTTMLLRVFTHASPYSEVVGVIDNAGPVGIDSPGDPAGQAGGANATDLRIHAYVQSAAGHLRPADRYQDEQWSDGNPGQSGVLP